MLTTKESESLKQYDVPKFVPNITVITAGKKLTKNKHRFPTLPQDSRKRTEDKQISAGIDRPEDRPTTYY